jgi:hypothetical protein
MVGAAGGRTSSLPRINIEPTILRKKIEDSHTVGAFLLFVPRFGARNPNKPLEVGASRRFAALGRFQPSIHCDAKCQKDRVLGRTA